jgi:hypothetical protein
MPEFMINLPKLLINCAQRFERDVDPEAGFDKYVGSAGKTIRDPYHDNLAILRFKKFIFNKIIIYDTFYIKIEIKIWIRDAINLRTRNTAEIPVLLYALTSLVGAVEDLVGIRIRIR